MNTMHRSFFSLAISFVACNGVSAQQSDADIARAFYPDELVRKAERPNGDFPHEYKFARFNSGLLVAAYSNGQNGAVRLLERTPDGVSVADDLEWPFMDGHVSSVTLRDLDGDQAPEVVVSFGNTQAMVDVDWPFRLSGKKLVFLGPSKKSHGGETIAIPTNATYTDIDGDGKVEIIDQKIANIHQNEDGSRTEDEVLRIYALRNGMYELSGPATYVAGFERGKGEPRNIRHEVTVKQSAPQILRVVNGDSSKQHLVSSAEIRWNGALVVGPNAFNQNMRVISVPISAVAGVNQLDVKLFGAPGGELTVVILPAP